MCNALLCESEFQNMSCRENHIFPPGHRPLSDPTGHSDRGAIPRLPPRTPSYPMPYAPSRRITPLHLPTHPSPRFPRASSTAWLAGRALRCPSAGMPSARA